MYTFVTMMLAYYLALTLREFAIWAIRFRPKRHCRGTESVWLNTPVEEDATTQFPAVAIFHTICNDFTQECFESLIETDYPNKAIFVLDDSQTDDLRTFVEGVSGEVGFPLHYRHRTVRRGNKAGNVNDALHTLSESYRYVFLADSDQIMPRKILASFVLYLEEKPDAPFIQVHNKPTCRAGDEIPHIIVEGHHVHALLSSRYRSILRTPPCIGHGVLVRRKTLALTDGLPEIVSEDIAWSLELLTRGKRGAYYSRRFMGEAFPPDYRSFSKRFLRWSIADLECGIHHLPRILVSQHLSLIEKADLVTGQLRYPSVSASWVFGVCLCLMPDFPPFGASQLSLTICLLMGLLPILNATRRMSWRALLLPAHAIPLYFSQVSASLLECMRFAIRRKATFHVTGDRRGSSIGTDTAIHLAIAATCAVIVVRGALHPLLVFFAICECVRVVHHWFPWSHILCRLLRAATVGWVVFWILMAYYAGGVWLREAHFFVVGLSLFF